MATQSQVLLTVVGVAAASLSSLSYIPQVMKAWPKGSTADLSIKTLISLGTSLSLWVVYGALAEDRIVLFANMVGGSLVLCVLFFKVRDLIIYRSQ